MREYPNSEHWLFTTPFPTPAQLQAVLQQCTLTAPPGTAIKYSNVGYALLGQLIEAVSGCSYIRYTTERIIAPLQLKHTTADYIPDMPANIPIGYGGPQQHPRPTFLHRRPTNAFAAATGVYTNPSDMCRFAASYFPGDTRLLSNRAKKEALRTQQQILKGYDAGYTLGLGLEIYQSGRHRLFGHSGHMGGHTTATLFDPKRRLAVSVMANSRETPSIQIANGLFDTLEFFARHATEPTPKHLARCNARLANALGVIQIVATANAIVMIDPDEWEPFAATEQLQYDGPDTLRIVTEGSVFNQHELLRYVFTNNKPHTVHYSGIPMRLLPDDEAGAS